MNTAQEYGGTVRQQERRGPTRSSVTGLNLGLNAAPIEVVPEATVEAGIVAFEDRDRLAALRRELRGTHLLHRRGDRVRVVRLHEQADRVGDEFEQVSLRCNPDLLCALVRECLIRIFHGVGRGEIRGHKPVALVSSRREDDLLRQALRSRVPSWLGRKVLYEFDTRFIEQVEGDPLVVLSVGVRTVTQIEANCAQLVGLGVPLAGRYVEVDDGGDDHRLSRRRSLAGFVRAIEDGRIELGDARPDIDSVSLSDAYLEPRAENLAICLRAVLGAAGSAAADRLRKLSGEVTGGPSRLERASRLLRYLREQRLELAPGLTAHLGELVASDAPLLANAEVFDRPMLIFHPGGSKASPVSYSGLDEHGPYDQAVFPLKRPRIAIICQAHRQGDTEAFVETFFDGIRGRVFGKGFLRRFALGRPEIERFFTRDSSSAAYEAACKEAVNYAAETDKRWDLALVQTEDQFKELPPAVNPYLVSKAILFRHQIPAQAVTMRTVELERRQLEYALNNLSLACYAKLGGTPWVLEADRTVAHELVIGLRSYKHQQSRFGSAGRYVGLTTVFKGDGQYLLGGRTRAVPFKDYSTEMLSILKQAVHAVREQQNWDGREHIRLIFHAFKPMKFAEIDAVRTLMRDLGLPNAEFAFVHMVEDHPFAVTDTNQRGVKAWPTGQKGIFAPPRGLFIPLGRTEGLLTFKGPRSVKQETDGLPRPVLMRLHSDSSFSDIRYLARQAFNFSCHSWRTFGDGGMPITVSYSGYIAEMLGLLQAVPGWSDDAMLGRISFTRWFL